MNEKITLIQDKALEPFELEVSISGYALFEKMEIEFGTMQGQIRRVFRGSYPDLDAALHKIVRFKLAVQEEVVDLEKFVQNRQFFYDTASKATRAYVA